jgi:nucleoside-diphosphate-sugar epimerase
LSNLSVVSSLEGKKILVTGSNGFLGSHLCKRLSLIDCDIIGIDNFSFSSALDKDYSKQQTGSKIVFKEIDITNREALEALFNEYKFDMIFHLAAVANPRTCKNNINLAIKVNVEGTRNLLDLSIDCQKFLFMSSASVYGEPQSLPIDEAHPKGGTDEYSLTKIMGEDLCFDYIKKQGQNVSLARNFNTFGIGQSTDYIVPTLISQALRDNKIEIWSAKPVRDLTYIEDTINALILIATNESSDVFNIGSGRGIQIGELAHLLADLIDKKVHVIDLQKTVSGSSALVANNAKLKNIGWEQKISLEEGLSRTVEWFKSIKCIQLS